MLRLRCASTSSTWTLDMPQWGLPLADGVVGEVGEVLCGVGDAVKRDEPVVVVETDKVSVDIRASRDGVVAAVLAVEGDEVSEGQPLLRFAFESETAEQQGPRDWADAHRRRRLAQAEEAQLRFEQWQVRWQKEQAARWAQWRSDREGAWWRGQAQAQAQRAWGHTWQRQQQQGQQQGQQQQGQQGQRQQGQRQHKRQRTAASAPGAAGAGSSEWGKLPAGEVRRLLLSSSHYAALGLARDASQADVRQAFRRVAMVVHPDRFHALPDSPLAAAAPEAFLRLQQANWVLSHPGRRRDYDRSGW